MHFYFCEIFNNIEKRFHALKESAPVKRRDNVDRIKEIFNQNVYQTETHF